MYYKGMAVQPSAPTIFPQLKIYEAGNNDGLYPRQGDGSAERQSFTQHHQANADIMTPAARPRACDVKRCYFVTGLL